MGVNNSKRLAAKCAFLTKDEQVIVSQSFRLVSKNSEKIKEDDLVKLWGSQMDSRLMQYITNYLFTGSGAGGSGGGSTGTSHRQQSVEFEKFAEMYVFCIRGTADERLQVLLKCLGISSTEASININFSLVKEFVESIVSTYIKLVCTNKKQQYQSWTSRGSFQNVQHNVQTFSESLIYNLVINEDGNTTNIDNLIKWISTCCILGTLLQYVFNHLYHLTNKDKLLQQQQQGQGTTSYYSSNDELILNEDRDRCTELIPYCRGLDLIPSYPSLLDLTQLIFINAHLPKQKYKYEWRFLFSSEIHGESFSTLIGRIINQGPCVLIIEETNGFMFGAFASESWVMGPKWYGDDTTMLFTLTPKMRIFNSTNYNQHYQYLNLNQQTMPNGLGFGGQFEYFGLWLDSEYGQGHTSETCSTFKNYTQMSHHKQFQFSHLEVWGLGMPEEQNNEISGNRSILDGNLEAKRFLEMAGKTIHSEGVREPPNI